MMLPLTATAPRLLTEETCAPAMLTSAEVISSPEVDSAFSTERVTACEAAARSTIMPLRMPSEGSMPTPRMRMDLSSSTRPTRVHTLVVPTSMPTTISSMSFTHSVVWRGRIRHIDQRRPDASLRKRIYHRLIHAHFQFHISCFRSEVHPPAARVIPAKPKTCIIDDRHSRRDMLAQSLDSLHHVRRNEGSRRQRIG